MKSQQRTHASPQAVSDAKGEDIYKQVLQSILYDVKGALSLVESGPNLRRIRSLKIIRAMLEEDLER